MVDGRIASGVRWAAPLLAVSCTTGVPSDLLPELGTGAVDPSTTSSSSSETGDSTGAPAPEPDTTTGGSSSGSAEPPVVFDVPPVDAPGEPEAEPTDIEAVLTADNAYAFGYGTEAEMRNYFGGVESALACEIFCCADGPEAYTVPAEDAAGATYLYIVAYADAAVTQGVLGQFRRVSGRAGGGFGAIVYTGDPGWEVCATGIDYGPGDGAPTLETVNEQIELCNGGATDPDTTSQGWVDEMGTALGALAVGEPNDTARDSVEPGNEFPIVCDEMIDAEAHWMWFNWDPDNIVWPTQSPFMYPGGENPMHDFMIFRLAAEELPFPPQG
jgi:hypothetical protein